MIPPQITPWLQRTANCAVMRALRFQVPTAHQEPEFVAAVVWGAIPEIAMYWEPIFNHAGLSAKFSAVFCHQSPMATFQDSQCNVRRCELADLLVVVDDTTSGTLVQRRAVLVQAKMAESQGGKTLTRLGDLTQLELYSTWPSFELGSGFPGGLRDFSTCLHAGKPDDCGRYGLIGGCPLVWHQQEPAQAMPSGGVELGTFLARMVESRSGYGREATGLADDWSRTIEDLMRITFNKVFRLSRARWTDSRGISVSLPASGNAVGLQIRGQDNEGGPSGRESDRFEERPGDDGISLLHVEIASLGERYLSS